AQAAGRAAVGVAIAANAVFPLVEFWRIAIGRPDLALYAALATGLLLALHLRHVVAGLRGERARASSWTLGGLVLVNAAAAVLFGRAWALQFPSLAVSVLLVLRAPLSLAFAGAVAVAPPILVWAGPFAKLAGVG